MIRNIQLPAWYQEEFYNRKRTPEEWLYEIYKRYQFNREDLNFLSSIRLLPLEERQELFLDVIYINKIDEFLSSLQAIPSQPIKHLTVSDVFRMHSLIYSSDEYKNHPDRKLFESAIVAIINNETLSDAQKTALHTFHHTSWHFYHKNTLDETWYPNKDISYLSGIPLSLDPTYAKKDITKEININLSKWVGKLQYIELHFETWQESKILAVYDLIMWFKIQNVEFTNINLHRLIWPNGRFSPEKDEYINPDDDIKHSIKLKERVISNSVIQSLASLCEARKFNKQFEKA